jgi:hypothetical protein
VRLNEARCACVVSIYRPWSSAFVADESNAFALEPGGRRIVMTGGGTLAGGAYLIDVDPATGNLQQARDLPATASGIPGIRFDSDEWPHGKTGPAFAHGAVFSRVK